MIVKIVKVYLGLSLVLLWQCRVSSFSDGSLVWLIFLKIYTSKAVPPVLASSVCWSLQCLFSALTQGGRWWTLFFFLAHVFSCAVGREGCCKQITLACARSVSAMLVCPCTWHTPLRLYFAPLGTV